LKNSLTDAERSLNLIRFCRSMEKLRHQGIPVDKHVPQLFLSTYWKDPEKASLDLKKFKQTVLRRKLIWKILEKK
jgi:hypothetical protein